MTGFFEDDDYYTGPPLDSVMVRRAEEHLRVRLPAAYIDLLHLRNGGVPRSRCFPTDFPTSWAPDHIQIDAIRGVGGEWGIDSEAGLGNATMIAEWGYPEIGVVICEMPSAGHDTIMLDYTECGPRGEPAVAYIDEDRVARRIAESFEEFLNNLTACKRYGSTLPD